MNVLNITDENDVFTNSTQLIDDENDNINIILKLLLSSIPIGVLLLFLIGLIIRNTPKRLLSKHQKNGKVFICISVVRTGADQMGGGGTPSMY